MMNIIPQPQSLKAQRGAFVLTPKTTIIAGAPELTDIGRYLAELLAPATGMKLPVTSAGSSPAEAIVLTLDAARTRLGNEGYALECTPTGVTITAPKPAGVFYGMQTLRQLLPSAIESRERVDGAAWLVPCVAIEDWPRFPWRGFMLDTARHFRTKEELLRYIDLLAFQKMNIFHLHLTDEQGWRVEVKCRPKLTSVGAGLRNCSGKTGAGWFYTQAEIREIVAYASRRQVNILPEIDMPGHSTAATTAYPELSCTGTAVPELCISKESTFDYVASMLSEVLDLFPFPFFHIGGDEVWPERWRQCPHCQGLLRQLEVRGTDEGRPIRLPNVTDAGVPYQADIMKLHGHFIRRLDRFLAAKGRRMVGWDEILEGGLAEDSRAVPMVWRMHEAAALGVEHGHDVVVSLFPHLYLDNQTSLERTYAFEPVPGGATPAQATRTLGVQGNMWGERTPTIRQVDCQTFPRLCAIAEIGWSSRQARDFADFLRRLAPFRARLDRHGVRLSTGYVTRWNVSRLMPSAGKLDALAYPGNQAPLGLADRDFGGAFCSRRDEFIVRAPEDVLVYYQCFLDLDEPMTLAANLGYDGPVKVWVDGKVVFADPNGVNPASPDDARVVFEGDRGRHEFLVALGSNAGRAWGIWLQFERQGLAAAPECAGVALPKVAVVSGVLGSGKVAAGEP